MNSDEAKVPDDNSDWQAIDIYIFSNGQKYSPPRKYHLRAEELNWWDATLNFLARSQYGPKHPLIYLYTIDGRRVEGPLELKDGAAYVAVEPPERFINASYEKYLIKASRSWEKRQAKRAVPLEAPIPEKPEKPVIETEKCCSCFDKDTVCHHEKPCCMCVEKEKDGGVITIHSEQSTVIVTERLSIKMPAENLTQSGLDTKCEAEQRSAKYETLKDEFGPRAGEQDINPVNKGSEYIESSCCAPTIESHNSKGECGTCRLESGKIICEYGPMSSETGLNSADDRPVNDTSPKENEYLNKLIEIAKGLHHYQPSPESVSGICDNKQGARAGEQDSRPADSVPYKDYEIRSDTHEIKSKESSIKREILHKGDNGAWMVEFDSKLGFRITRLDESKSDENREKAGEYESGMKTCDYDYKYNEGLSTNDQQITRRQETRQDINADNTRREYEERGEKYVDQIDEYEDKKGGTKVDVKNERAEELRDTEGEILERLDEYVTKDISGEVKESLKDLEGKDVATKIVAENERILIETGGTLGECKRIIGESVKTVVDRRRLSGDPIKLTGDNGRRILSEPGKILADNNRRIPGDQARIPEHGRRISSEPGKISVDPNRIPGENRRRLSGEAGKNSITRGRILVDHGRTSIDNGKITLDHGKISYEPGKVPCENGDKPLENSDRTENGPRLSVGGTAIPSLPQQVRKSSIASAKALAESKRRASIIPHPTFKKPTPNGGSKKTDERKPNKNGREIPPTKTGGNIPGRLSNVSEKAKMIVDTFSHLDAIPTKADLEETVIKTISTSLTKILSSHKSLVDDSIPIENVTVDKDVIVVSSKLYRNPESDIASMKIDTNLVETLLRDTIDDANEAVTKQASKHSFTNAEANPTYTKFAADVDKEGEHVREMSQTNSKSMRATTSRKHNNIAGDSTGNDNFIAIINKGDVINLKLNLELRNAEGLINTGRKTNKKSRSLTNIAKSEKSSQISVDQEMIVQSKSLQSLLNKEFLRGLGNDRPKVLIVKCACCGHNNKNQACKLPNEQENGCNKCQRDPHMSSKRMSSGYPVRKTTSNTSLETLSTKGTGFPFPKQNVQMYVLTTSTNCQTGEPRDCSVTKRKVSITEGPESGSCTQGRSLSEISIIQTQYCVSKSSLPKHRQPTTEAFTQTDMCNLLLEARRHDNGRYSFHLPPLHVLRYYDL